MCSLPGSRERTYSAMLEAGRGRRAARESRRPVAAGRISHRVAERGPDANGRDEVVGASANLRRSFRRSRVFVSRLRHRSGRRSARVTTSTRPASGGTQSTVLQRGRSPGASQSAGTDQVRRPSTIASMRRPIRHCGRRPSWRSGPSGRGLDRTAAWLSDSDRRRPSGHRSRSSDDRSSRPTVPGQRPHPIRRTRPMPKRLRRVRAPRPPGSAWGTALRVAAREAAAPPTRSTGCAPATSR